MLDRLGGEAAAGPVGRPAPPAAAPLVWHLIDSSTVGGAERHITTLAAALETRGCQVRVVQYADLGPSPWFAQMAQAGVSWRVLDGTLAGLMRAMRAERPDLLHTHGYKAGILGRLAAIWCGIPLISTFHTGQRSGLPVRIYEWLDEWTSFVGERIVVSEAIRRRLPFSSDVVPSWVAVSSAPPTGALPRQVAFVGRLSPEKRPDIFCGLAGQAPAGEEWHVYGDGPMRRDLERRYGGTVRFHGIVADLDEAWRTIGLLVMPSLFEGVPLAALEALAHGVPVLATRVGGVPSVVQHGRTGWLCEVGDIAGALNGLAAWRELSPLQQRRLRAACWSHVRNSFSEAVMLPRIAAAYGRAGVTLGDAAGRRAARDAATGAPW